MQSEWQRDNLAAIEQRLAAARAASDGVLYSAPAGRLHVQIHKQAGQVLLYFYDPATGALDGPMSRIVLDRPLYLAAEYSQALLLALIWLPQPERICMLGFGGGRMSLVLHHHLPAATIDNVDIDPIFAALAQRWFGAGFDERQRLVIDDARHFLERADRPAYAMIVMDAFSDHHDDLDRLGTAGFYACARRRLDIGGVLGANFLRSDPHFPEKTWTFCRAFGSVAVVALKHSVVLFGSARRLDCRNAPARAEELCARLGLDAPLPERAAVLERYRDSDLAVMHRAVRPVQLTEKP